MRAVHLQQQLCDLRERERLAKLHNKELLLQFDEAQKTLREMLDRTAAMKMLRKEYETYYRDHRGHLKTQTIWNNMPVGYQKTCVNTSGKPCNEILLLQGRVPRTTGAYQGVDFPLDLQPSYQSPTQTQTSVLPKKASEQLWDIAPSSASSFPHSSLVGSHQFSSQSHHPYAFVQTSPFTGPYLLHQHLANDNTSNQHNTPHSDFQSQNRKVPKGSHSFSSKKSQRCAEDLDVNPVRLSSRQGQHKDTNRTSSQGSSKDGASNQSNSSDEDQRSSHTSLSLEPVATKTKALRSESESSERLSNRTSKQSSLNKSDDTSSDNENNESDTESPNSNALIKSSSFQQEVKEGSGKQTHDDETDTSNKNDEASDAGIPRFSSEEQDHETDISEDEKVKNTDSASTDSDGGEDVAEEPEKKDNAKKVDTTKAVEHSDSEDCIVSPQTRSKIIYVIPEHPTEHEESSKKTSSSYEEQSSSESSDGIEQVLAPQEHLHKNREKLKPDGEENVIDDAVVCREKKHNDSHSDSNESDDFYD